MPYSDPAKARQYQKKYRQQQRAGGKGCTARTSVDIPPAARVRTAADVLRLLEEAVNDVRADADAKALEKARCIAYVSGVVLRAIEVGDLAARVEALEALQKQRGQP